MKRFIYIVEYILFLLLKLIVKKLPNSLKKRVLNLISKSIYISIKKYRVIVKKNLQIVFGEDFAKENYKEFTLSCIQNLLYNIIIIIENLDRTPEDIKRISTFQNREVVDELLKDGKSIIFSSAHFWHWEMLGAIMGAHIGKANGVVERLKNGYLDRVLTESREKFGINTISMRGALRGLIKAIKRNENIFILMDQSVNRGQGVELPFFGTEAIHSETNSYLSKKYNLPIVHTYIKVENGNYIVEFEKPIWANQRDNSTLDELKIVERKVKENPKKWLWCHRRWKNLGDIYRD